MGVGEQTSLDQPLFATANDFHLASGHRLFLLSVHDLVSSDLVGSSGWKK